MLEHNIILKEHIKNLCNGETIFGSTRESFNNKIKIYLRAYFKDHFIENGDGHEFRDIITYNRCVICSQYIDKYVYAICESCVDTCTNYKTPIWMMGCFGLTIDLDTSMHFFFAYHAGEYIYGPYTTETEISDDMEIHRCFKYGSITFDSQFIMDDNDRPDPSPCLIRDKMINNSHNLFDRYRKTTSIIFLLASKDNKHVLNMLVYDVVGYIFRFLY